MIEVRWHGRGGQGAFTVARILGLAASVYEKKYSLAFPSFGPERRGAPVLSFTKIDDKKIRDRSEVKECDYVVVLDHTLMDDYIFFGLKEKGLIVINSQNTEKYDKESGKLVYFDATTLALEVMNKPITNTAMLGALIAISGIVSLDSVYKAIDDILPPGIRSVNKEIVQRAYSTVKGGQYCE